MYNVSAVETDFVKIEMESGDSIVVALDGKSAPLTVANFKKLVGSGFYNGLIFHRVIRGFMIQGGCPQGRGTGGPGYGIRGEFSQNGFKNDLCHHRGVISMARAQNPNSAGSQFFIMHQDAPHLDGAYAAFGKVIEGINVVDDIADEYTDFTDRPYEKQVMQTVTVETFGINYPEPTKM